LSESTQDTVTLPADRAVTLKLI